MKKQKEKTKRRIKLADAHQQGLLMRQGAIDLARKDYSTYLQAVLDAKQIEGDWTLTGVEGGCLILEKREAPTDV